MVMHHLYKEKTASKGKECSIVWTADEESSKWGVENVTSFQTWP